MISKKNENKNRLIRIEKYKVILATITAVVILIPVFKYFYFTKTSTIINSSYILCYRDTAFSDTEIIDNKVKPTKAYSFFDSITLNFAMMNNNPLNNFFIGNLYLYISDDEKVLDKLLKNKEVESDSYFIYQAQYIFERFDWENVEKYVNSGSYQVLGITSNESKVFNIEFYPVNWTLDGKGRNKYNFKGNTKYYILLFEEKSNGSKRYFNKNNYYEIYVNQKYLDFLHSFYNSEYHKEKANIY